MEFCPKCGSVILVEGKKANCAKCSYKPKGKIKIQTSQKGGAGGRIAVIDEKKMQTYPIVPIKCPECKAKEAFFWTMQTRSSDEAETKFYKCVDCEHTWREYQ
ncbi:MAG: transcription factor S [Candidatus Pacearchaeota archaeon]|nr:transcription factor S [Candidatus Pacearchaeota archaeon]